MREQGLLPPADHLQLLREKGHPPWNELSDEVQAQWELQADLDTLGTSSPPAPTPAPPLGGGVDIDVRMPPSLANWLSATARAKGMTMDQVVQDALQAEIDRNTPSSSRSSADHCGSRGRGRF